MPHGALLYSEMTPEVSRENEFNEWYDDEHIPLRMAVPGFRPALEDIDQGNSLPCVLPDKWGRQFRVRGDVQATLLCGLKAPSDNRPSSRAKAADQNTQR